MDYTEWKTHLSSLYGIEPEKLCLKFDNNIAIVMYDKHDVTNFTQVEVFKSDEYPPIFSEVESTENKKVMDKLYQNISTLLTQIEHKTGDSKNKLLNFIHEQDITEEDVLGILKWHYNWRD